MKGDKRIHVWMALLIAFSVFTFYGRTAYAVEDVYEKEEDVLYAYTYKNMVYSKMAGSPLDGNLEEGVDPSTGYLNVQRVDLALEGIGGMDFNLSRYYNSNEAALGHATVEHVEELTVDTIRVEFQGEDGSTHSLIVSKEIFEDYSQALKDMFFEYEEGAFVRQDTVNDTQRTMVVNKYDYHVYGIASGWQFDLPWIETVSVTDSTAGICFGIRQECEHTLTKME